MITYEQARQNLINQVGLIVRYLAPTMVKFYTPDERVTLWKAFDQTARKWEPKFAKGAAASLEHDKRSILALLTGAKSLAKARKATVDWKKLLKDIEDYMAGAGTAHWRDTFAPLIEGIVTDQGEKWAARLGTQFDVQNLYARDWFNNYTLEFAQPINDTTLTEIGQVMARAQEEGSSIPEIQDQLDAMFEREISGRLPDDPEYDWYTDRTPPYRTEMIARTETCRAQNAGTTEIFTEWGVQKKEWLSTQDDRTRFSKPNDEFDHVVANGQVVGIDEPFIVSGEELQYPGDPAGSPGNTINCIVGETELIPIGELQRVFRRYYSGDIVKITTRSGQQLSVTPNHPILTERGWIDAHLLDQGDNLIGCRFAKRAKASNPDIDDIPTRADEIFNTLALVFTSKRVISSLADFHGDGVDREIEIISVDRKLSVQNDSAFTKHIKQFFFAISYLPRFIYIIECSIIDTLKNGFRALWGFMPSFMSSQSIGESLLDSHLGHPDVIGFAATARNNANGNQAWADSSPGESKYLRKFLFGNSRKIEKFQIVDIDIVPFIGHVYNLQTESGFYLANGIIAHNCRCTVLPVIPEEGLPEQTPVEEAPEEVGIEAIDLNADYEDLRVQEYDFISHGEIVNYHDIQAAAKDDLVTALSGATGLSYSSVDNFIREWAKTSNDNDRDSLLTQKLAAKLFGGELSAWQIGKIASIEKQNEDTLENLAILLYQNEDRELINNTEAIEKILTEMYSQTQTALNQSFPDSDYLVLYRGAALPGLTGYESESLKAGDTINLTGNVLESWSADRSVARRFSDANEEEVSFVFEAKIPKSLIVGTARTGFGCLSEYEFVVQGNLPGQYTISSISGN